MDATIAELIDRISALPADWHGAGSVNTDELRAIATHAAAVGSIEHSVETGSGKTTLLFSHLSKDHRAFAIDSGDSISQVRRSPLFRAEAVRYIEGPTQVTLPAYHFADPVQIAMIDGPHAYPFPDLEYYYFYPLVAPGGLLIVDDFLIPSIGRMVEIIKADRMFELLEIVSSNMAIFRRTSAPLLDPHGDDWWQQGYNKSYYDEYMEAHREQATSAAGTPSRLESMYRPVVKTALRTAAALAPQVVKDRLPAKMKKRFWKRM
jgi:hypothetical protein